MEKERATDRAEMFETPIKNGECASLSTKFMFS